MHFVVAVTQKRCSQQQKCGYYDEIDAFRPLSISWKARGSWAVGDGLVPGAG